MGGKVGGFISNPVGAVTSAVGGKLLGNTVGGKLLGISNPMSLLTQRPGAAGMVGTDMGMASGGPGAYGSQQYDSQGRPILADRQSNNGADGMIKSQYQTMDATNTGALDQARQESLRAPGQLSKYGQMALAQGQNQNAMTAAGKQSQALNGLAMQGGLRSGARERLAASGMQGQLQANQNTYSTIQNQDEQSRQSQLQTQVGNELSYGQNVNNIQNTNIGRGVAENQMQNDFNMNRYGKAMEAWGADKSSQAAAAQARQAKATSGLFGGGGFLGTGLGGK